MFITEKHSRTLVKTILYRILCTIAIYFIALALSADSASSGKLALVALVLGTLIYYIHDRVWNKISWNRDLFNGKESNLRSLIKTLVYRIITFVIGVISARILITDSNSVALSFAIGQFFANMIIYFLIERISNYINRGRVFDHE